MEVIMRDIKGKLEVEYIVPAGSADGRRVPYLLCASNNAVEGDTVINVVNGVKHKAVQECGTVGYISGPAFLYFRDTVHRVVLKKLMQEDMRKLLSS